MTVRQNAALKLCSDKHSNAGEKSGPFTLLDLLYMFTLKKLTHILSDVLQDGKKPPFLVEMTYLILSMIRLSKKYLLSFALSLSL